MNSKFNDQTTAEEAASCFAGEVKGKTVLVTGCTWGGLGAESARVIAKYGAGLVIVSGRRKESLNETIKKIKEETPGAKLFPLIIDLASLASIRLAAKEVNQLSVPIDILINNAAIMAPVYETTLDGFESHFGTNHLGPFLFTSLIMPRILESKSPRIVNVSSMGYRFSPIRFNDYNFTNREEYSMWRAYGQSKTANILFSLELSNRYKKRGVSAFSLHPGVIKTNLGNQVDLEVETRNMVDTEGKPLVLEDIKWKTIEQGASTHIVAALDPSIKDQSGSFLHDAQINNTVVMKYALDEANARELWSLSEQLVGQKFNI
ncbi:hypothetical protein K7432_012717 [Basidiobolus ranarum]|uniref:Short-chain dehydrogenase n=1 Tax=Basidiobolus ranarum TaxID=34480 RepID=A0ABR2WKH0_9FUNG